MKLTGVFVSSIICLNSVVAKKHGLRRVLRNPRNLDDADASASAAADDDISCQDAYYGYYGQMDTNGDGTITNEEEEDAFRSWGFNDTEIESMLYPYGPNFTIAELVEDCENYYDDSYTCEDGAVDFFDELDTNADGTVTYEEAAETYANWGFDDTEIEYILDPYGPGDSLTQAEFIEESCADAKRKGKKGLLTVAETVQKIKLGHKEKKETKKDFLASAEKVRKVKLAQDKKKAKKHLLETVEKVEKIKLALKKKKAKKDNFWKKVETKHNLDGAADDDDFSCQDMWDVNYGEADTNGDGEITYEEAVDMYRSWGVTDTEIESQLYPYGPGDVLVTEAEIVGTCENYYEIYYDDTGAEDYSVYTCEDGAVDFFDRLDTNADGTVTYEEAADTLARWGYNDNDIVSWGYTDGEIAFILDPDGPDSLTQAEFIEVSCADAKRKAKKGLLTVAETVQKIKLGHKEKKETGAQKAQKIKMAVAQKKKTQKKKSEKEHKMALHIYSEADVNECKGFFEKMDLDKNGELSIGDLEGVIDSKAKANVDKAEIRQFVEDIGKADLNNDEIISKKEFMTACLND